MNGPEESWQRICEHIAGMSDGELAESLQQARSKLREVPCKGRTVWRAMAVVVVMEMFRRQGHDESFLNSIADSAIEVIEERRSLNN